MSSPSTRHFFSMAYSSPMRSMIAPHWMGNDFSISTNSRRTWALWGAPHKAHYPEPRVIRRDALGAEDAAFSAIGASG
jgi:hypothetical protein